MSRAPKPIDPTVSPRHRFGFTLRDQAGHSLQGFTRLVRSGCRRLIKRVVQAIQATDLIK